MKWLIYTSLYIYIYREEIGASDEKAMMNQGSTGVALEPTKVGGDTRNFSANGKKKKKSVRI